MRGKSCYPVQCLTIKDFFEEMEDTEGNNQLKKSLSQTISQFASMLGQNKFSKLYLAQSE